VMEALLKILFGQENFLKVLSPEDTQLSFFLFQSLLGAKHKMTKNIFVCFRRSFSPRNVHQLPGGALQHLPRYRQGKAREKKNPWRDWTEMLSILGERMSRYLERRSENERAMFSSSSMQMIKVLQHRKSSRE
jgi:hypothetical protein